MSAVWILWLRELKRYTRSRAQMAASLGQPTLYLLALGFGLGPTFQQAGNGSYLQFLAPSVRPIIIWMRGPGATSVSFRKPNCRSNSSPTPEKIDTKRIVMPTTPGARNWR